MVQFFLPLLLFFNRIIFFFLISHLFYWCLMHLEIAPDYPVSASSVKALCKGLKDKDKAYLYIYV